MNRQGRLLAGCVLGAALLLSSCAGGPDGAQGTSPVTQRVETTQPARETPSVAPSEKPSPTSQPDQAGLFSALAGESVMGLLLLEPTQEELALAGAVEEVFPPQEYGERMLIVPRLPDSIVIIQQLRYDQEGALTGVEEIWRSQRQPAAVLLQQDVPEGYPTLRVVIQAGERTGSYDVSYYGKGDGRRDFYIWLARED